MNEKLEHVSFDGRSQVGAA